MLATVGPCRSLERIPLEGSMTPPSRENVGMRQDFGRESKALGRRDEDFWGLSPVLCTVNMGFPKGPASKGPGSFLVLDIHK